MSDDESTSTRSEELDELLGTLTTEAPDDAQVDALIQSLLKATEDAVQRHEMELAAALESARNNVPQKSTSTSDEAPPRELVSATQRRQLVLLSEYANTQPPAQHDAPEVEEDGPEAEPVHVVTQPKRKGGLGIGLALAVIALLGLGAYFTSSSSSSAIDLGDVDKRIEDEVTRSQALWSQTETCLKGCKEDSCDTQCVAPLIAVLDSAKIKEIEALVAQRRIDRQRDALEAKAREEADKLGGTAAQAERAAQDAKAAPADAAPTADAPAAEGGDPVPTAVPAAATIDAATKAKKKKKRKKKKKKKKKKGFF